MKKPQLEPLAYHAMRETMHCYYPLSDDTWQRLTAICHYRELEKNTVLYSTGDIPVSFSFVYQGLFRVFTTDTKGNEYNKNFFSEGMFPGSISALLQSKPSTFSIVALEPSTIIEIDFKGFRQLLDSCEDLKWYQIHYLEKNWLILKEAREIEIVQEDATSRYMRFCENHLDWLARLPQHHIASHLGITPTQLSRIRKKMSEHQPM